MLCGVCCVSLFTVSTGCSRARKAPTRMVLQRLESPLSAACRLGLCSAGEAGVSTYGAQSSSIIKLNNGLVLYLREVNRYLALVCLLREENFEKHGLIVSFCGATSQDVPARYRPRATRFHAAARTRHHVGDKVGFWCL